jgi:hypothetical protein
MGAHSSIRVKEEDARKIFRQHVGPDVECTSAMIEAFFDRALDDKLYNLVFLYEHSDEESFSVRCLEEWVVEYLKNHPEEVYSSVTNENILLRRLLAIRVTGVSKLYVDDGELQDNSELPAIDFKRDSADLIQQKLVERSQRKFEAEQRVLDSLRQ